MYFLPKAFEKIIRCGRLVLIDPGGNTTTFAGERQGPQVVLQVHDRSLDVKFLANPELRFAEAYIDGKISVKDGDIRDFVELIFMNRKSMEGLPAVNLHRRLSKALRYVLQLNPRPVAQRRVSHHYDLTSEFYEKWLDDDMQYSCAYWDERASSLDQAQLAKKRHIAAKLRLAPGQKVLDIGSGWGGTALYLAGVADVRVKGITLSREQLERSRQRAFQAGLADRVEFELCDYRDVTEAFDRIVSVGMLEHVGSTHLKTFFRKVHEILPEDGIALIHSIGSMSGHGVPSRFIRKHIFPGTYTPPLSATWDAVERAGLWPLDCEIWRIHYAKTLFEWWSRFQECRAEVVEMYDERFARMWELYLAGCEMIFVHAYAMVFQIQLGRTRDAAPITRDYMVHDEEQLRRMDSDVAAQARSA